MPFSRTLCGALVAIALSLFPSLAAAAGEPVNSAPPRVTGAGLELSSTNGSWTGQTRPFNYEWLRCEATTLESCKPIPGATRPTYLITRADLGARIRSRVTASNESGFARSASATKVVPAIVSIAGLSRGRLTVLDELVVRGPADAIVRVRCTGVRCPVRRLTTAIRGRPQLRLRRAQGTYGAGAVLEIRVINPDPGRMGKFTLVRFRSNSLSPVRTNSCLRPGASDPTPCP